MSTLYRTIVADPPWPMPETGVCTRRKHEGKYEGKNGRILDGAWWNRTTGKSVRLPYQTMSLEEIMGLSVKDLSDANAHLYLWTTNKFLESSYGIARSWGFEVSTVLTWCKPPQGIGFGGTYCNTTEFCLFCRRGTLKALRRVDSTWWKWSRPYANGVMSHSEKPEAFQDMVESVSPGPYLELFARRQRLGWHTWGNEALNHVNLVSKP